MSNYTSLPDLERNEAERSVQPSTGLFLLNDMNSILKEQVIILKRINSKLWKINTLLEKEVQENDSDGPVDA